jgi:GNAT superfamily N-acetyltransferase
MPSEIVIRHAVETDVPLILGLIRELSVYEKLVHEVVATEEALKLQLFGEKRYAEVNLAFFNNEPAGFALFFHNFSTFLAKPGIYLEDLYVHEHLRGNGIGKALLVNLFKIANERGCGRVEWSVLDWNTPAIDFYKSLGAAAKDEWTLFRITGEQLKQFGNTQS